MFHDFMFGGMWFAWLFWFIILVLVIWVIMRTINKNNSGRNLNSTSTEDGPLDILKKRLAKGEISEEEYNRLKKNIE